MINRGKKLFRLEDEEEQKKLELDRIPGPARRPGLKVELVVIKAQPQARQNLKSYMLGQLFAHAQWGLNE